MSVSDTIMPKAAKEGPTLARGPSLMAAGAALLWLVSERGVIVEPRWLLLGVAAALWLAAAVWRGLRFRFADERERRSEALQGLATLAGAVSFGLYVLVLPETLDALVGHDGGTSAWVAVARGAWLALLTCSALSLVWVERARGGGPHEGDRLANASLHGLALGLALVAVVGFNYTALIHDKPLDLSMLRVSEPSPAVQGQVAALKEPITAYLIFEEHAEVLPDLQRYFEALTRRGPLKMKVVDHALEPELVKRHRIRGNGYLLFVRGEGEQAQADQFRVGSERADARPTLRSLDSYVVRSLSKLTRPERTLYLTRGHGERSPDRVPGQGRPARLRDLTKLLERFNITHKPLGLADGLARGVPEDASGVAMIGPEKPLLPEEVEALTAYVRAGGRLWLALEGPAAASLQPLLDALGIVAETGVVTCQQNHMVRTRTVADREIIVTNRVGRHAAVTTAARSSRRAGIILLRAGALQQAKQPPEGVAVTQLLRAMKDCFLDRDGDREKGDGEPGDTLSLGFAVTLPPAADGGKQGRVVVFSDADMVTDQVLLMSEGNTLVTLDVLGWLLDDDAVKGAITSEEDVPIEHRRDQDRVWFYATTYGVPFPVFLAGWWVHRRRTRRAEGAS